MSLIQFRNVTKTYRKHFWTRLYTAVDDLTFSVDPGRIVGFIGPNGAGKTTSIKMLLGLAWPTRGEVRLNGIDAGLPAARRGVAYLSEQPYFYEHLTVDESLRFAYQLQRLAPGAMSREVSRVLEIVELVESRDKKVKELSKGMQQRLSMAQALLGDSHAYILDEPMSGLDPLGRSLFRRIFRELIDKGKNVFFSTHILEDIESLCDSIVVLSKGKLLYQGAVVDMLARGFLGTDITVQGLSQAQRAELEAQGYAVGNQVTGEHVVFIDRDKDPAACQQWLFGKGVYPKAVERRNRSLEELLYGESGQRSAVSGQKAAETSGQRSAVSGQDGEETSGHHAAGRGKEAEERRSAEV